MDNSEPTEHISRSRMELFSARGLPETELATVARHLAKCSDCGGQFVSSLRRQKGTAAVSFNLAPEFWLKHEHIDYDQLVEFADDKLEATDRELIDLHLEVCPHCKEDVRSFLAFREQIASELEVSYATVHDAPRSKVSWWTQWNTLAWKPAYAAVLIIMGLAVIFGAILLKRRSDNLQAQRNQPSQNTPAGRESPRQENSKNNSPTFPAVPNEAPITEPNAGDAVIALEDESGRVTVAKSGSVSGLDDVPAPTRDLIAKALTSEAIEKPAVLRDLAGPDSRLRGTNSAQSFKLMAPARAVILDAQPVFKWEKLPGASGYRVYVTDPQGREVAKSDDLPQRTTEWKSTTLLKRGEIYSWSVVAVVDGKEIVSPGPALPEMKFKILSSGNLQELNHVRRTRSHLARGITFAKFGMIPEARREFQRLLALNPKSDVARKLLRSLQ